MSRQSPTSISTRIIMSFPGVPWQVGDTHRGSISRIHQWPVFKWGGWGSTTLSECHRMPVGSKELLNAEPEISHPPPTTWATIWFGFRTRSTQFCWQPSNISITSRSLCASLYISYSTRTPTTVAASHIPLTYKHTSPHLPFVLCDIVWRRAAEVRQTYP